MNHSPENDAGDDGFIRCLCPIAETSPAGVDVRLEPEHELLRSEIAKLSAVHGVSPDWSAIESVGSTLLADKSKDLLVAAYVACALTVRDGMRGASRGAALLTMLLAAFGNALFPRRTRARVVALAWYLEWLVRQLDGAKASTLIESQRLREQVHQLREAAHALLGHETPSFVSLLRQCDRIDLTSRAAPTAVPAPASPQSSAPKHRDPVVEPRAVVERGASVVPVVAAVRSTEPSAPDSSQVVFGPPPASLPELQTYLARTGSLLVDLARCRFAADRADARSYRWLRVGVWLRWERAPTPSRRGRTDLDGPSPARYAELTKAREDERWDDLLRLSEQLLVKYPLWLDLNRWSALALERLGETFTLARTHVLRETQALLARVPELATLAFSDGSPFAASDTVCWLTPPAQTAVVRPEPGLLEDSLRTRLRQKEGAAVAEIERRLHDNNSLRTSFLLRLELASALEHHGQSQRAACVYLGLERDIDTHQLERWEPELALRALHPLWKLLSTREGAAPSEVQRLSVRLSQLSPTLLL